MANDSLFIGVSGLTAYQNQIDVISNNIANVGTTGYKGQDVDFQDLLYQNLGFASAPTTTHGGINAEQQGDGVKIGSIDTSFTQGGLQTTGVNTNLAINGNGFFALNNINGSGSTTYTRDGDFSLNESGYLYSPANGLAVLGYPVGPGGTISQVAPPQPIQIPFGLKSIAVGTGFGAKSGPTTDNVYDVSLGGNLDQTDYITAVSSNSANIIATTITTTMYDSLGGPHEVQITYQPDPPVANGGTGIVEPGTTVVNAAGVAVTAATEFKFTVTSTDGSTNGAQPNLGTGYIFFDQNGQFINTSSTRDSGRRHRARGASGSEYGKRRPLHGYALGHAERREQRIAGRCRYGQSGRHRPRLLEHDQPQLICHRQHGFAEWVRTGYSLEYDDRPRRHDHRCVHQRPKPNVGTARAGYLRQRRRSDSTRRQHVLDVGELRARPVRLRKPG